MEMQVKDLVQLLSECDPEALIEVGGGAVEYDTTNVEVVESNGSVSIQEGDTLQLEHYEIVDLPDDIRADYDKLVIFKSYRSAISHVARLFGPSFSGFIIVDMLLTTGNENNRFISMRFENGKMDVSSVESVHMDHHHSVRHFSSRCLMKNPQSLEDSVLTSEQKHLLHLIAIYD